MKSLTKTIAIVALFAAPIVAFAQTEATVSRAQVRAELVRLENAGFDPAANDLDYPTQLQAAEKRVQQGASVQDGITSVGGVKSGSVQSGSSVQGAASAALYQH